MNKILNFVLAMSFLILVSCSSDCNVANEPENTIYGLWEREVTIEEGETFGAYILFKGNGEFMFMPAEPVEGHSNSYVKFLVDESESVVTFYDDVDCPGDGIYSYTISDNKLTLTANSDSCLPRELIMAATWTKAE